MADVQAVCSAAIPLIKRFEGLRLNAYPDPASGGEPYTVGYGATGRDIGPRTTWTVEQAESDLSGRVSRLSADVCSMITSDVPDASIAAIVSFGYNVGEHALQESTLLKKLNAGDMTGAAGELDKWTRAAGHVFQGLVIRRAQEKLAFLQGLGMAS